MEAAFKKQYGINLDCSKNLNFGSYYSESLDTTELSEFNQKSTLDISTTALAEDITSNDETLDSNLNFSTPFSNKLLNKKLSKDKILSITSDVNMDIDDTKKELSIGKQKMEFIDDVIDDIDKSKDEIQNYINNVEIEKKKG